jgi:peroxiredoxin
MIAVLDNTDPASDAAFDAAQWILLNTPDGSDVEKAARIVLENHVRRLDLEPLCQRLERIRHRCAPEILAKVLKENPQPEVQATACFALATLRKDESKYGEDKKTAAQAEALFERVIGEFGQAGPNAWDRSWKSKEALSELRRMSIGKPAPDFAGKGLQGHQVQLSDYRGKVVAVVFWYASEWVVPEENLTVLAPFADRGLVCLSVYSDDNRKRAMPVLEKYPPPGPVIWDGNHGPIADAWQVHSWPSVFVLDRNGIIRARNARGPALADAVSKLLATGAGL